MQGTTDQIKTISTDFKSKRKDFCLKVFIWRDLFWREFSLNLAISRQFLPVTKFHIAEWFHVPNVAFLIAKVHWWLPLATHFWQYSCLRRKSHIKSAKLTKCRGHWQNNWQWIKLKWPKYRFGRHFYDHTSQQWHQKSLFQPTFFSIRIFRASTSLYSCACCSLWFSQFCIILCVLTFQFFFGFL